MRHEFNIIRLWEQPTEVFLQTPGLLPFAVLSSQGAEALPVLRQVARNIDIIPERRAQANITASAAILAGLVLETDVIQRVLRRDIMRESAVYQEILQEGLDEGREREKQKVAIKLLQEGMSIEKVASITELSVEEVLRLQG